MNKTISKKILAITLVAIAMVVLHFSVSSVANAALNHSNVSPEVLDDRGIEVCHPFYIPGIGWIQPVVCASNYFRILNLMISQTTTPASGTAAHPTEIPLGSTIEYQIVVDHTSSSAALMALNVTAYTEIPAGLSFHVNELRGGFGEDLEMPLSEIPGIDFTVTGNRIQWTIAVLQRDTPFTLIVPTTAEVAGTVFENTAYITQIYHAGEPFPLARESASTYHIARYIEEESLTPRERLAVLIAEATARTQENYTPLSWARMQSMLVMSRSIYNNQTASVAQINEAIDLLRTRLDQLVPR